MKMLYERVYERHEIAELLGTNTRQGIKRKLNGYGVFHLIEGRGEHFTVNIRKISDPFKVFCILDLNFPAQTDFKKLREFYWYYFNDDEFMAMPDEVKEVRMRENGRTLTRQTIATYTRKLIQKEYINPNIGNYIYYFACKGTQTMTDEATYKKAWQEYWEDKEDGADSYEAIDKMVCKYGGYARKQPVPEENVFYLKELLYLQDLIGKGIEDDYATDNFKSDI